MQDKTIFSKKYIIKTLTPMHIGTGEVLDPFKFIVDKNKKCIYVLDMEGFFKILTPKEREDFIKICDKADIYSIIEIYRFMSSKLSLVKKNPNIIKREVLVSDYFLSHFEKVKNLGKNDGIKEINQFKIELFFYDQNLNQPVIPGSSIKGSIRTAILNYYSSKKKISFIGKKAFLLEKMILDYHNPQDDCMKILKVSDFLPVNRIKTKVIYAINRKKDGSRASGPYQMLEVVDAGELFEGTISVLKLRKKDVQKINLDVMEEAISEFYNEIFEEEKKIYQKMSISPPFKSFKFPMKIGRHTGAESMTIKRFGKKISTTIWLASDKKDKYLNIYNCKPLAWVELISYERFKAPQNNKKTEKQKTSKSSKELDFSALNGKFKIKSK